MALERKELLELMKAAAQATSTKNYNYKGEEMTAHALNETLRQEINELCGDFNSYRRNHVQLFELVEETVNLIAPNKIADVYSMFAETKTYPQGTRPKFRITGLGKQRAKQFITRVGLAGLYETFKLGETWFEVKTSAIGGAAKVGFEEFLDGRVDFAELVNIVIEGMAELIQKEIATALMSSIENLPDNNHAAAKGVVESTFDGLISVASAYGTPTIYCTRQFAMELHPESNSWLSERMKDEAWYNGFIANYKGVNVVILPNTVTDETNTTWAIDPSYAWIIPSDGNTKPVKVAFEGGMHMKDIENYDWSHEIHFYQKVGVGVIMTNNICVYRNTELSTKIGPWPKGED